MLSNRGNHAGGEIQGTAAEAGKGDSASTNYWVGHSRLYHEQIFDTMYLKVITKQSNGKY